MDIRKLQRVIVNALEDVKAQDIKIFNTSKQTALFERVIVATANSNRQTRALGHHVSWKLRKTAETRRHRRSGDRRMGSRRLRKRHRSYHAAGSSCLLQP